MNKYAVIDDHTPQVEPPRDVKYADNLDKLADDANQRLAKAAEMQLAKQPKDGSLPNGDL